MENGFTVGGVDPEGFVTVRDTMGLVIARFPFQSTAHTYCDWRNNPTPQPKFKVGDRLIDLSVPTAIRGHLTVARIDHSYVMKEGLGHSIAWADAHYELAPPEPRAVVKPEDVDHDPHWWLVWIGNSTRQYRSQEQAEYIAAGLNEHPDWSL